MKNTTVAMDNDPAAPTKDMKYRVTIGESDFDTKTAKVGRFLQDGHRVRITVIFRGREIQQPELGVALCDRVGRRNRHVAQIEVAPRLGDDRAMTMVLAPFPAPGTT